MAIHFNIFQLILLSFMLKITWKLKSDCYRQMSNLNIEQQIQNAIQAFVVSGFNLTNTTNLQSGSGLTQHSFQDSISIINADIFEVLVRPVTCY